jgi:hypothetical protein
LIQNQGLPNLKGKHKAMSVTEVFGDVAGILAQMDPEKVLALEAPASLNQRVEALVAQKK